MLVDTNIGTNDIELETAKAYKIRVARGVSALNDNFVWVPKSQVTWKAQGCEAETMHVPAWLANKLGI